MEKRCKIGGNLQKIILKKFVLVFFSNQNDFGLYLMQNIYQKHFWTVSAISF